MFIKIAALNMKRLKKFTRENFAKFLKTKKDSDTYYYSDNRNCLFAKFLKSMGYKASCASANVGFGIITDDDCGEYYQFPNWAKKLELKIHKLSDRSDLRDFEVVKKALEKKDNDLSRFLKTVSAKSFRGYIKEIQAKSDKDSIYKCSGCGTKGAWEDWESFAAPNEYRYDSCFDQGKKDTLVLQKVAEC